MTTLFRGATPPHPATVTGLRRLAAACCVVGWVSSAWSLDIEHSEANYVDKEYRYSLTAVIDAPVERVETILRDFEGYKALDARILEAHVLERPSEHVALLSTTLRACFGPICRSVKRVEQVEQMPHALMATTDPKRSDMQFGETRMQLDVVEPGRTRVSYQTRLKPDFWIPALIARRMMLETLEDATLDLFRNVERKARESEASTTN